MHVSGSCSQRRDSTECCVAVIVTMFLVPGLVTSLYTLLQLWWWPQLPVLCPSVVQHCLTRHSSLASASSSFNIHLQQNISVSTYLCIFRESSTLLQHQQSASAQLRVTKRGENSWWNILTDWSTYASHWHYKVDQLVKQTSNVREKLLREWLQVISRWPQ